MYILGITAPISWNSAAALVQDGVLIAAAEEERFLRVKHAPRTPPLQAIRYCLETAGIALRQVECLAVGFDSPASYFAKMALEEIRNRHFSRVLEGAGATAEYVIQWEKLQRGLRRLDPEAGPLRTIFVSHHVAHAASAYRVSGFSRASVVTLDGNGEDDSGLLAAWDGTRLRRWRTIRLRDSLGVVYSQVTDRLGFIHHSEEGKTMGLAAYGTPRHDFQGLVTVNHDHHRVAPDFERRLANAFGPRRRADEPLGPAHHDWAASVQRLVERAGAMLVDAAVRRTGAADVCLAGGVALNCDMNMVIQALPSVRRLYVQPAAHDAGTALGAAMEAAAQLGETAPFTMDHAYWGPEYSSAEIETVLKESKVAYERCEDIAEAAAELLVQEKIIGWFQGRMEWGPRALGNRSILAHPGVPAMKDRVNGEVKHRELWRPFAPSLLEEQAAEYLERYAPCPFMLVAHRVKPAKAAVLAAATHVDGTVRPQSVSAMTNPLYHRLISRFAQRTGIPAVLNTSFNDRGEPLVMSPRDALRTFWITGLDALAIGPFLLRKSSARP